MTPQQIYNPYIDHDAPIEPTTPRTTWKTRLGTLALVILIVGLILTATACDHTAALRMEQDNATAFYPQKPSHEQQVAYREDEREQLRLNQLIAKR